MSKINGIDVSECEFLECGMCNAQRNCDGYTGIECKYDNESCYYRQLKRLQEENEELKRRCEEWAWDSVKLQAQIDSRDYQLNKHKEILKDIRDIIEMPKYTCKEFLYIRGKINEALNDRD